MQCILTPKEMRQADNEAINIYNIPSLILMENAARSASEFVFLILNENNIRNPSILILCGSGNNGGDGFALARHILTSQQQYSIRQFKIQNSKFKIPNTVYQIPLSGTSASLYDQHYESVSLEIFWLGDVQKMSEETKTNFSVIQNMGVPVTHIQNESDFERLNDRYDCIIDALIGVGGSENLKGIVEPLLIRVNKLKGVKIAIDTPTGLNSENGFASQNCFCADYTITMYAIKTGMLLNQGADVCGNIMVANLGAPLEIIKKISKTNILEYNDLRSILKPRRRISSKFDYGKVVIIAGSRNMAGAAALCSNAAIMSGAGLVYLFTTAAHSAILPDIITNVVQPNDFGTISIKSFDAVFKFIEKADVVAIGPGLGDNEEVKEFVQELLKRIPDDKAVVIDADALKSINGNMNLRQNIVITPHSGEFSLISGIPRNVVEQNSFEQSKELARKLNCVVLLKHIPVIITNGKKSFFNVNGNPGMATAGSGDVLTGIIAGLIAQHIEPFQAAALGAFLHASAGDWYVKHYLEETLTASELINSLKHIIPEC